MKKITICLMTVAMSFTFIPTQVFAAKAATTAVSANTESAAANVLLNRLSEIKAMDKSNLTAPEKKELRSEVKSIREQLKGIGGGVYISAGALILILVLLIIFL
ncbi:MAG: hypothetical protein K9G49_05080 [Taibaiella sp.]|nr:hypothetical protein [Taibaiella sp.]